LLSVAGGICRRLPVSGLLLAELKFGCDGANALDMIAETTILIANPRIDAPMPEPNTAIAIVVPIAIDGTVYVNRHRATNKFLLNPSFI
jgi:hypothetical protein